MATEEDDFDTMFDKLILLKDGETLDTVATPTADPAVEPVIEPVVEPVIAQADPVVEPVIEPVTEPTTREVLEQFTKALTESKKPLPAPTPEPVRQAVYTDAEVASMEAFAKDWPEQFAAIQAMLRGTVAQNNDYTFGEISKVLAPALEQVQTVSASSMHGQLQRAIPDYDQIRDKAIAWATSDAQPDYLKNAYVSVIENGTVHQITDLVGRWRESTGAPKPAAVAKPAKELSEAAKQAVQSLAPVVSQRTVTVPGTPTSYDDAFEAFSKAG